MKKIEKNSPRSFHRVQVPLEQRLPLNVRSAGHALVDSGWEHAAGDVDRYNLYWGITGEVHYTVNSKHCITRQNEIMIFPLNSRMGSAKQSGVAEYRWFTLDGPMAAMLFKQLKFNFFSPCKAICPVILHDQLLQSFADITPVAAMNAEIIAYEIMLSIRNTYNQVSKDNIIDKCRLLLDTAFTDCNLDISAVADQVGIDRTVMSRRFKSAHGISPSKYLQSKRLMHALKYLESGCTTIDTARFSGYNDAGYFARSFKRHFGMSPQEWRDSMIKNI